MNLQHFQENIKGLLKETWLPTAVDDPYFKKIHQTRELAMVREIAIWWRAFQLENFCPITSRYLKRSQTFEALVAHYYQTHNVSPFIEEAGIDFLSFSLKSQSDKMLHAIAQFEQAMIKVRKGSSQTFQCLWDKNPYEVLAAIFEEKPLPEKEKNIRYEITIAATIPHYFQVQEQFDEEI